jgi:DNA-binding NarL/FixJ family response regulator
MIAVSACAAAVIYFTHPEDPDSEGVLVGIAAALWHLTSMLLRHPELKVVCEVSDGLEAVQSAEKLQPDLVLLDMGLPSLSGIEAARRMRGGAPRSKILFLTLESSPDLIAEAFNLGASGYISKMDAGSDLLSGINAIVRGKRFLSKSLTPKMGQVKSMGDQA